MIDHHKISAALGSTVGPKVVAHAGQLGGVPREASGGRASVIMAGVGQLLGVDIELYPPLKTDGPKRAAARRAAAIIMRACGMSYPEIAHAIGWKSHTSAMKACGKGNEE